MFIKQCISKKNSVPEYRRIRIRYRSGFETLRWTGKKKTGARSMGLVATYIIPPTLSIILFYLGWRVSPEEGEGREGGMDPLGHGHVGQQHELLDQLVGLPPLLHPVQIR